MTVAHLVRSFATHLDQLARSGILEPATPAWYSHMLAGLVEQLGEFPAGELRAYHLTGIDLTNGFTRAVKRLMKWAAAEDLIPRDAFQKLTVPPCGRRERVLTRAELRRLYRASPRALRLLLFVQLNTIARPGEVRELTWSQVAWEERVLILVKFKGKKRRRDGLRARVIPLPPHVLRLLLNLHRKSADPSPAGRVFLATRGAPWTANGARCAMRRARAAAGLDVGDEPVVCYHLRHTAATTAARADVPLAKLAALMGHARTSTTERYVHLSTADVVAAADALHSRRRAVEK